MSQRLTTRRRMLQGLAIGTAGLAAGRAGAQEQNAPQSIPGALGAESPAAAPAAITPDTIANAERVFGVQYTDAERAQLVEEIDQWIDRMVRLRQVDKPNTLAPATVFDPRLPGVPYPEQENRVTPSGRAAGAVPADPVDIAFAPVWKLAEWIRTGALTSRRLTDVYLSRIERHAPRLECFVTVTPDIARREADAADAEIAAGGYRGPLHGIPYGMKDIVDVGGVRGTWGATPWRDRIAENDAVVTQRLREAGAVLLGKTTNGAIAYGDRWFDGITRNPFNPDEGSSGSSAGSASATAAGLVGFAIGTETLGSIVSPSHRCGTTGLRPTFGRVPRDGAMALCWSLDKVGPLCRSAEDTAFVLAAMNGLNPTEPGSLGHGFECDVSRDVRGMRVGYNPAWFENAAEPDRAALQAARDAGVELVEVSMPDLPYDALFAVVEAESAAAFEALTLSGDDDTLVWQDAQAWPNTWRRARFISAVDMVNVDRLRRHVMQAAHDMFSGVDAVIGPNFAGAMLVITNFTGHPCLAFRSGFVEQRTRTIFGGDANADETQHRVPHASTVWAPLFQEGNIVALARAIEERLGVSDERPPEFAR